MSESSSTKYIVVFKPHATPQQIEQYAAQVVAAGGQVGHRYDSIIKGFSANIPDNVVAIFQDNLADSPVDYIEPDSIVMIQK